jgi:Ca2+-binding RTX toxin-like protein
MAIFVMPPGQTIRSGTPDADRITGNSRSNRIDGLGGDDTLIGGMGIDFLQGGAGADRLNGGNNIRDWAIYETSNAAVQVTLANNRTGSGSGGHAEGDTLVFINGLQGSAFGDTLTGNRFTNYFIGGGGNDTISGGAGGDALQGGAGADSLDGGDGLDTVIYSGTVGVTVDLASAVAQVSAGDANGDVFTSIEAIFGSDGDDTLRGGAGGNRLTGAAGDDVLEGRGGGDRLSGGLGIDTASYASAAEAVRVNLGVRVQRGAIGSDSRGDVLTRIENAIGSAFGDRLTGSRVANRLDGGGGNDALSGGAGADTLDGGDGDDLILADGGADSLVGGTGTDFVDYSLSTAGIIVDLNGTTPGIGGTARRDVLIGIENVNGTAFADRITGNGAANDLRGRGGNDRLVGAAGADTLQGGSGFDTADYSASAGGVTVSLAAGGVISGGDATGDVLISIENLIGSNSADTLEGNGASNVLNGGNGADTLTGGGGADAFVFTSAPGSGVDTITDFISGVDRIRLDDADFTGLARGALAPGVFKVLNGTNSVDGSDRIIYNRATGEVFFDVDGLGGIDSIRFAQLDPGQALRSTDFIII